MNCPACEKILYSNACSCGWQEMASPVPYSMTREPKQLGITKEEFGMNLYDTIATIGGLLGLEQQRAAAIFQNRSARVAELLKRRKVLQATLAKRLPGLTNDAMDGILARYPWVTGC